MVSESFRATWSPRMLSVLRIIVGLLFLEHGLSKYFGFPGPSPATFQVFGLLGLAGAIETVAGVLVTVGLFTRIAAFIASGEMAFAYFISHFPRNFFPMLNQGDAAILYCFIFLFFALEGGGPWGIDAVRSKT
jgi:putative oxidoreductase